MKKVGVFFLFIIGFTAVFFVSGFISYFCFSGRDNKADEINATESVNELPRINVSTQGSGNLTIITPGLNEDEAIVRYGTKEDIVTKQSDNENSAQVFSVDEMEVDEKIPDTDGEKAEESNENKAENKTEPEQKKEAAAEKPKTETKTEVKTEPRAENKPVEKPVEEKPEETTVIPKEEVKTEPQKPQLNPNIQTSDSGL